MPTISAMDPGLRYDDQDNELAQRRAQNQDYMMRQYLQNQQLNAQQSAQANALTAQERMHGADIADRGAGRQAAFGMQQLAGSQGMDLAKLNQQPQMAGIDFMKQKYADERGDTAGTRDFANTVAQMKLRELQNLDAGGAQPMGANPQAARDARSMKFQLLGLNAPTDPQEQAQEMVRKIIASRMANADESDLGALAGAYQSGDLSQIPKTPKQAIDPAMLQEAVGAAAQRFGEKDAASIGFDPTETDVADVIRQRDQLAQSLKIQRRGISDEQAKEAANFVIEQKLLPNADRWGTGWIQRLREALRGQSQAAPQMGAEAFMGP